MSLTTNLTAALSLIEACNGVFGTRDFDRALDGIASDIRNCLSEVEDAQESDVYDIGADW